ncbi:MAG: (d)CMP kinase [Candidatus Hydrogenedentes bacterium]|nr:(d)CMP kinase [Candidatus Hydrogenedentota bacterium]
MTPATQIIVIDGPAGAGKSSVAKAVAHALGFAFLDTGAMYRAATWRALHHGLDLGDTAALIASTRAMNLALEERAEGLRVVVDGEDITDAIRTPEVTRAIFRLDQIAGVRELLVAMQREIGAKRPTVAEGRDMGSVVFPEAKCKIFLDADLSERSRRRAAQLREKGIPVDEAALAAEIHERDEQGRNREHAPLVQAADAIRIDTTGREFEEIVDEIVARAREVL